MDNNRYYDDEREIDLIDILGRIIAKWRPILVVTIVGLVIGIIISCTMGYFNMKKSDVEAKKVSAAKAEALALEKLLKDEKGEELQENADKNLIKYVNIQSLYEMQEDYTDNSIYQNLDATRIAKAELSYYVDNHYVSEYPVVDNYNNIGDIIGAYRIALLSDETCNGIINNLKIDTEPKYIRELVSIGNPSTSNLVINIMTDDEAISGTIAEYYKGIMNSITEGIIENYGDVTTTLQEQQLYTESDIDVMTAQNDADSKVIDYYNQLQAIEKSMSGAQGDYFEAILAKYNLDVVKKEAVSHGYFYYVSKKLIVIVAIAFAFIAVAIYGCMYLFDGKVKTGDELASMSRSTLLGTVLVDNDKKKKNILFDKWAVALTDNRAMCDDSDKKVQTIVASIVQYLKANGLSSVLFVGSDVKHVDVVNAVNEGISAAGFTASIAIDAFDSPETVNSITSSDVVLFVCETGQSKYKKLERVLALCNLYKKQIIGTVAIQERV